MRRLFVFGVFLLVMNVPLHAQASIYSRELSPLDITAVHIVRSSSDPLTLKIEGIASTCGNSIHTEWYSDVYIDFLGERPAADRVQVGIVYHQFINLSLFTLPSDDHGCDLDRIVEIELPEFIEMPDVPNRAAPSTEWDAVLLVNDYPAWFTLADDSDIAQAQPIDFGETELIRWQKVDSVIEDLYSLGADPGYYLPWLEGYHPDGCEAPTLVNITRNPIENDNYTANVFRLLPEEAICPTTIQPFVVTAAGVVPQRDILLHLGGTSIRVDSFAGTTTPAERRYASNVTAQIESTGDGFHVLVSATVENYDVPVNVSQAEIEGVTFLNIYYDVPTELPETDKEITVEEVINVSTLPIIVNGMIMPEQLQ